MLHIIHVVNDNHGQVTTYAPGNLFFQSKLSFCTNMSFAGKNGNVIVIQYLVHDIQICTEIKPSVWVPGYHLLPLVQMPTYV